MKSLNAAVLLSVWGVVSLITQSGKSTAGTVPDKTEIEYRVGERGPHHQVWQKITPVDDGKGGTRLQTNVAYIEMAAGLNRLENGKWVQSEAELVLTAQGAEGRGAQHFVKLAANLNSRGAIQVKTPGGKWMKSQVVGLAFHDVVSGNQVMIADVKSSVGQLTASNVVLYPDAFDGLKADVRYTFTRDGFEQDIILRERPPEPEDYGLDPETTDLMVLTEYIETPRPERKVNRRQAAVTRPEVADEELDFGEMRMGDGRAFKLQSDQSQSDAVSVNKQWTQLDGRTFLVERVQFEGIRKGVADLPERASAQSKPRSVRQAGLKLSLPPVKVAEACTNAMRLAMVSAGDAGYVLDYNQELTTGTYNNYTFKGDTTYYISGPVTLTGTTTIEGGTVVKYAKNVNAMITLGAVICKTDPYRMAVFTAKDDNSVGETLGSGSPSGYYASSALKFTVTPTLKYLRFAFATQAINLNGGLTFDLRHSQIIDCGTGVYCNSTNSTFYAGNVLLQRVTTGFAIPSPSTLRMENLTFRTVYTGVLGTTYGNGISRADFYNCLFSSVSFIYGPIYGCGGCGGCCGGCGCCGCCGAIVTPYPTFVPTSTSLQVPATAFVQVGAGASYLANGTYRNAGTNAINQALAVDLESMTTFAPDNSYVGQTIAYGAYFGPRGLGDTDQLDLGYHYPILDYLLGNTTLSSDLYLYYGVAIGLSADPGLKMLNGSQAYSWANAFQMNRVVSQQNVQEQRVNGGGSFMRFDSGTQTSSQYYFESTDFSVGQGKVSPVVYSSLSVMPAFQSFDFKNCWLRGGSVSLNLYALGDEEISLINNKILRGDVAVYYDSAYNSHPATFTAYNNLLQGGSLTLTYLPSSSALPIWTVKDNLFDGATQTINVNTAGNTRLERSNNGFTSGTTVSLGGANNQVNLTANFQSGPFGIYYYPNNSTPGVSDLFLLVNAGSRSADDAGLSYSYTDQANQTADSGTVDIGYHHAVLSAPVVWDDPYEQVCPWVPHYVYLYNYAWDPNGLPLSYTIVTQPTHGTLTYGSNPGEFKYVSSGCYVGVDHFTFKVSDGYLQSTVAMVTLTVSADTVTAYPQSVETHRNTPVNFSLSAYSSCGVALTYSKITNPTHGTVTLVGSSAIYTPTDPAWEGTDSFVFKASNACGVYDQATVTVKVGYAPQVNDQTVLTVQGSPAMITMTGWDSDNDNITYSLVTTPAPAHGPANGTVQQNGSTSEFIYAPNTGFAGVDSFTFKGNDGVLDSELGTITVGVIPPPEFIASCRENKIVLNWGIPAWLEALSAVSDFEIQRATAAAGPYTVIATPDASTRQYIDTTVTPGTVYYYILSFHFYDQGELKESLPSDVVVSTCPVGQWGPTDVAFVIDNTGSMGGSLDNIVDGIASVLDDIITSSMGDYRLALVTPDTEVVDVRLNFANQNRTAFETELAALFASGGAGTPESTDECLNTVVHALAASGRPQNINFTPAFRPGVRKLIVVVTDAPPGGFDDNYDPFVDGVNAHQYAVDAATNGIKINAVLVGGDFDAHVVLHDYATTTCGWFSQISSSGVGIVEAIREMLYSAGGCQGPVIITQPQSQQVIEGANVTFTVVASGTGTLHYQWLHNNVTVGTASTLTLNNVQLSDAGTYFVRVSDDVGTVFSDPATLAVLPDPSIVVHPKSQTVMAGANVTFSVTAISATTMHYQWYKNASTIGSDSPNLTLTGVQDANEGEYYVTVTSSGNGHSVTSQHATLTVISVPEIQSMTLNLSSDIVPPGTTVTFTGKITTVGGQQLEFQNPNVAIAPIGTIYGAVPAVGSGSITFPKLSKALLTYVEGDTTGNYAYTDPNDPNYGKERGGAYQLTWTIPGCPLSAQATVVALPSGTAEFTAATKSYTDQLGQKLTSLKTAAVAQDKPAAGVLETQIADLAKQPYFDAVQLQFNQLQIPVDGMPVSPYAMSQAGLGNLGDGANLSTTLSSMASQLSQITDRINSIDPKNLTQTDVNELTALVAAYQTLSQQFAAQNPSPVGVHEAADQLNSVFADQLPKALDAIRDKSVAMADAMATAPAGGGGSLWGDGDWWTFVQDTLGVILDLRGYLVGNQIKAGVILANSLANIMLANLINSLAPSGLDWFGVYASAASGFACPLWDGLDGSRLSAVDGFSTIPTRNIIVLVGCVDPSVISSLYSLTRGLLFTPNMEIKTKIRILINIIKLGKAEYSWQKGQASIPPLWWSTGLFAVGFPATVEDSFIDEGLDLVSPQGWPKVAQGSYGCEGTVIVFNIRDFLFHAENVWFLPHCP